MEAVARIALALARHRQVDGDQDRLVARVLRPFDQLFSELEVANRVELEPEAPADLLGHALDGERRGRGHGEGHAGGLRRARQDQLRAEAAGADAAGGGDGQRQGRGLAEDLDRWYRPCETLTSTFGSSRTRSKAARFSRSVPSSSAPPSKKSKMARGRRRFASRRRSSMFTAFAKGIIAGHSTFESQIRVTPVRSCRRRSIRPACRRADLSVQAAAHHLPVPARRRGRHRHPRHRQRDAEDPRPGGHGREQARRRRQPRRARTWRARRPTATRS